MTGSFPWPRITVVTPSYQQAHFLEETLWSVLGQRYPALEYVVLDGGSSDGSRAILERHNSELSWWISEPDDGQAAAINRGFSRATGDLFCWLNSDDILLPGALRAVAEALRNHLTQPALVYGGCLMFGPGCPTPHVAPAQPHDAARLARYDYLRQPAVFWTRALWDAVGPLDATLRFAFDWDWFCRAARVATSFTPIQPVLAAYRIHESAKTVQGGDARWREVREVVRRHADPRANAHYAWLEEHRDPATLSALRRYRDRAVTLRRLRLPVEPIRWLEPCLWKVPSGLDALCLAECADAL